MLLPAPGQSSLSASSSRRRARFPPSSGQASLEYDVETNLMMRLGRYAEKRRGGPPERVAAGGRRGRGGGLVEFGVASKAA